MRFEYPLIGGIEQFLLHVGPSEGRPVVLHLHGGPGLAFSNKAWQIEDDWGKVATTIFWDQRGAGKTVLRNPDVVPTTERLLEDIREIIEHLKATYNVEKIGLLGHSWGSVLGTLYAKRRPEDLLFYMGTGQVVDAVNDERIGAAELRRRILLAVEKQERRADEHLSRFDALGEYPCDHRDLLPKMMVVRELQTIYGMGSYDPVKEAEIVRQSPVWDPEDATARNRAVPLLGQLYAEMSQFNLLELNPGYEVPVYLVLGSEDWQVPAVQGVRYFNLIQAPRKELVVIEGARHAPMLEAPKEFLAALSDALATTSVI